MKIRLLTNLSMNIHEACCRRLLKSLPLSAQTKLQIQTWRSTHNRGVVLHVVVRKIGELRKLLRFRMACQANYQYDEGELLHLNAQCLLFLKLEE